MEYPRRQAFFLFLREPPEKHGAKRNKEDIRNPDKKSGLRCRVTAKSIRHDNEKEVGECDHQAEGKSDGSFLAVSRNPEWDGNQGESHASE
jgi:hypothetical protein